jgi:uncharacterized short protein YbdD (DUF466 family)
MLRQRFRIICKCVSECAHLMVGIPDYDAYVAHFTHAHPERTPMTYEEFFRERQAARYGNGGTRGIRCC